MPPDTSQIVNKAWNYAHVLRYELLSYMVYTVQITFLLFLMMADEMTRPPYNRPPIVPRAVHQRQRRVRQGQAAELPE
jgi:type I restriction enzyme M protein